MSTILLRALLALAAVLLGEGLFLHQRGPLATTPKRRAGGAAGAYGFTTTRVATLTRATLGTALEDNDLVDGALEPPPPPPLAPPLAPPPPPLDKATWKRKVAVVCGFDGAHFFGSAMNPGQDLPTVEQALWDAMVSCGLVIPENALDCKKVGFASSSRTDKGVSAVRFLVVAKLEIPKVLETPAVDSTTNNGSVRDDVQQPKKKRLKRPDGSLKSPNLSQENRPDGNLKSPYLRQTQTGATAVLDGIDGEHDHKDKDGGGVATTTAATTTVFDEQGRAPLLAARLNAALEQQHQEILLNRQQQRQGGGDGGDGSSTGVYAGVDAGVDASSGAVSRLKVFSVCMVTKKFRPRPCCNWREYEYLLPRKLFAPPPPSLSAAAAAAASSSTSTPTSALLSTLEVEALSCELEREQETREEQETQLRVEAFNSALGLFVGTHSFANFVRVSAVKKAGEVRGTIYACEVSHRNLRTTVAANEAAEEEEEEEEEEMVAVKILGQAFFYNQIRKMIGAAVAVSLGHLPSTAVAQCLELPNCVVGGAQSGLLYAMAPPDGLLLVDSGFDRHPAMAVAMDDTNAQALASPPLFVLLSEQDARDNAEFRAQLRSKVASDWRRRQRPRLRGRSRDGVSPSQRTPAAPSSAVAMVAGVGKNSKGSVDNGEEEQQQGQQLERGGASSSVKVGKVGDNEVEDEGEVEGEDKGEEGEREELGGLDFNDLSLVDLFLKEQSEASALGGREASAGSREGEGGAASVGHRSSALKAVDAAWASWTSGAPSSSSSSPSSSSSSSPSSSSEEEPSSSIGNSGGDGGGSGGGGGSPETEAERLAVEKSRRWSLVNLKQQEAVTQLAQLKLEAGNLKPGQDVKVAEGLVQGRSYRSMLPKGFATSLTSHAKAPPGRKIADVQRALCVRLILQPPELSSIGDVDEDGVGKEDATSPSGQVGAVARLSAIASVEELLAFVDSTGFEELAEEGRSQREGK